MILVFELREQVSYKTKIENDIVFNHHKYYFIPGKV